MTWPPSSDFLDDVEAQVGRATLSRGITYAREGYVLSISSDPLGSEIVGVVDGSDRYPYDTSITVTRSTDGTVISFEGVCSCPVGWDCKHVVALLLADAEASASGPARRRSPAAPVPVPPALPSRRSGSRTGRPARPPTRPRWEAALLRALPEGMELAVGGTDPTLEDDPALALQFDLVEAGIRGGPAALHLRLRPVARGRSGGWSRSGMSWSELDHAHHRYRSEPLILDHLTLLKELRMLHTMSPGSLPYTVRDVPVWLDQVPSRRVWDLLAEAQASGLPLIDCQRSPQPVVLHTEPVAAGVDVRAGDGGVTVRSRLQQGDTAVAYDGCLAIGPGVHGVAWWTEVPGASGPGLRLELAPLVATPDPVTAGLLAGPPIVVPPEDVTRFVDEYLPALALTATVWSGDGTVAVPEPTPHRLTLTARHLGEHTCILDWGWTRQMGTRRQRSGLWPAPVGPGDGTAELALVAEVERVVAGVPGAIEHGPSGDRLAAHLLLTGVAAARFVGEVLPLLAGRDDLTVEVDGALPDYRAATAAPVVTVDGSDDGSGDWFDLMVTVTVDGEEVPFRTLFTALAAGQSHLVLPSGTYFALDAEELRQLAELIDEARSWADAPPGAVRISRYQVSWWDELERLGILDDRAAAWGENLRALVDAGDRVDHPLPDGLQATLRDYQLAGFRWLAYLYEHRLGGVLADDMGLGKTVQALALICHARLAEPDGPPFLVVAPTSVVGGWASEAARFAPGLATVVVGETTSRRGTALADQVKDADLVVLSYALLRLDFEEIDAMEWAGLILDEAQFVKNHTSQVHRKALALATPFKLAVTGTPMENNLQELWALLTVVAPGLLADARRFNEYYRTPIEKRSDPERLAQLRRRIRPLMLRRTKEQVASELPPRIEQVLDMDLNPKQQKVYQTYLQRERQRVLGLLDDFQRNRVEILRSLTILRQAALDVSLVDKRHAKVPSTKLDLLTDMVSEIVDDGHRVLVFSQFTRFLGQARRRLHEAGLDLCYLDGRTKDRPAVIERFRAGEAPVFLISLKAGGFGLNLTEADYCILLDPWWNPATEQQAIDRTHRIGQTRTVMVYRMVAKGTIEEKVMALKEKKRALFANVLDSGDMASAAISADDIRGLLE